MSDGINNAQLSLEKRRQIMHSQLVSHKQEVYQKVPEIREIEEKIYNCGNLRSYYVLMGKSADDIRQIRAEMQKLSDRKMELLTENGYPLDYLEMKYFCNECKDSGFVKGKICSCMKKQIFVERQKELSSMSPMPECNFHEFTLEYYPTKEMEIENGSKINPHRHMKKIYEYTNKYAEKFTPDSTSLMLIGNSGLGKTHLACSIANAVMEKGYTVMYASARSLFAKYDQLKNDSEDLTNDILNCDLFVLDDLGAEYTTNYTLSALYTIINTRELNGKPCIFTTNITSQNTLQRRYGEKISSRLLGSCQKLYFFGNDIRLQKTR